MNKKLSALLAIAGLSVVPSLGWASELNGANTAWILTSTALVLFITVIVIVGVDVYKYQKFLEANNVTAADNEGSYQKQSWLPLKDYQRNRILGFIPSKSAQKIVDPQGNGITWNLCNRENLGRSSTTHTISLI